jgi:hypothetical protein
MNPHPAEVVAEARLEMRSCGGIQWLSRRSQNLSHDGRGIVDRL